VMSLAGRPVIGLRASDFTVLDNGQPETIVSFHPNGGANEAAEPPLAVTVVLDTLKTPKAAEALERAAVDQFLRQEGGPATQPITLLLLTGTGLWRVGEPAADGRALAEALDHRRMTNWSGDNWAERVDQGWDPSEASSLQGGGPIAVYPAAGSPAESALKALGAIAAAARREPGRKLLIWVGPGYGIGSGANPEEEASTNAEKRAVFDRIVWFSTLLRLAQMSVCNDAVAAPGAATQDDAFLEGIAAEYGILPEGKFPQSGLRPVGSPRELNEEDKDGVVELNRSVLAVESGGEALNGGDATETINQCVRDAHAAYTLTFNPAPAAQADDYHALRVELRDAGLTARANTGYYDEPYYSDPPDAARRRMSVAQLDAWLRGAEGRSDGDLARELGGVELTERASGAQIAAWSAALPGRKAREALAAVGDLSAFRDPPAGDVPANPPPDGEAQRKMLALAGEYVQRTIPRLPDFFARRTAASYEEIPAYYHGEGKFTTAEPLHVVDTSKTTVVFRNGSEIVDPKLLEHERKMGTLSTYGTFGPVLSAVEHALARPGALTWSRWEKDSSGAVRAVFRYSVPASASEAATGGCCLPDGNGRIGFQKWTGYQGEIAIDPATGAVLRVVMEGDLTGFVPLDRDDIMVTYGPVTIGDSTYICPLRSVSVWRARSVTAQTEWNTESFAHWGPFATKLNDFSFDEYHLFRAKVRILPGVTQTSP
jgi:VWFA-related protein